MHRPLGEMLGADERERLLDARPDLGRLGPEVLQTERNLVRDSRHHDLVLGILEHRRDSAGQLRRPRLARVDPPDHDATSEDTAVEMGHESRERTQQRRLAGARWPEHDDVLAVGHLERQILERGRTAGRVGERQMLDDGYSHSAPTTTIAPAPTSAIRSIARQAGRGARVRPLRRNHAPPSPRRD